MKLPQHSDNRPNIILIMTDQQRFDTIRALGFDYMHTPNLDRLVKEGVSFEQCHVTAPSCAPSRASIFTGLYPHTTGIMRNADTWQHSWIENLSESGYRCVNIGKMHTSPFTAPLGFHERHIVENPDRYLEGRYFFDEWDKALQTNDVLKQQREWYRQREDYAECMGAFEWEQDEDMHSDMFVGDRACWWIKNYPKTEPLFLQIGFPGPHPPYDPSPRFIDLYKDKELPLLPVTQEELDGQPPGFKKLRQHNTEVDHDSVVHSLNPTEEQRKRQRTYYLANVSMIDEKIGQILDTLDEQGYLSNCVVIFTSDHGDCLTDHGHIQKWTMYEQVTRVPLIVWSPGNIAQGKTVKGLCQAMDIGPTILEFAGLKVPDHMEAKSLSTALREDERDEWQEREFVFSEQIRDNNLTETDFITMVRDKRWKLVHFLGESDGQLFDLEKDPVEAVNLWSAPDHNDQKTRLLDAIREWHIRTAINSKEWASHSR